MSDDRLVQRMQRRLRTRASGVSRDPEDARVVVELASRVRRLRGLGDIFAHVRLSENVALIGAMGVPVRNGANSVATEV